jgi:uncharacterized membrane protein YraQ (UPF0718 family)
MIASAMQTLDLVDRWPWLLGHPVTATLFMMALAVVICLCSEADAFVAANMVKVPLAGKIGFMVLSPMFDLKLLMMYTRVFTVRLIVSLAAMLWILIFVFSLAVHYLDPTVSPIQKAPALESPGNSGANRATK